MSKAIESGPKVKRSEGGILVKVTFAPGLVVKMRSGALVGKSDAELVAEAERELDWAQSL